MEALQEGTGQAADLGEVRHELIEEVVNNVSGENSHAGALRQLARLLGHGHVECQDHRKLSLSMPYVRLAYPDSFTRACTLFDDDVNVS